MRAFVALMIEENEQREIAAVQQELLGFAKRSTVVSSENFHVTLSFLGNIDDDTLFELEDALDDVKSSPSMELELNRIGTFKSDGAETLWIAPAENAQLDRIQKEIARIVESCGIKTEAREFRAHITLARNVEFADAKNIDAINEKLAASPIVVNVSSFSLMQSMLGEGGPLYKEICAWE